MVKIVKLHYHDHVEICQKCSEARDKIDPSDVITGNNAAVLKTLMQNSCEAGRGILEAFWLSYKEEGES